MSTRFAAKAAILRGFCHAFGFSEQLPAGYRKTPRSSTAAALAGLRAHEHYG
jgi:hypothetical protein